MSNLLADGAVRLITLTGPGGTGKSRLAIEAARVAADGFVDGVLLVDLSDERHPDGVFAAIDRALGIGGLSGRSPLERIEHDLNERRVLLVLDNVEQVTTSGPGLVELLEHCPFVKILATSREALRVSAEHVFPVPPLSLPVGSGRPISLDDVSQSESGRLFIERAAAGGSGFVLSAAGTFLMWQRYLPPSRRFAAGDRVGSGPPDAVLCRRTAGAGPTCASTCSLVEAEIGPAGSERCATRSSGATNCSATTSAWSFGCTRSSSTAVSMTSTKRCGPSRPPTASTSWTRRPHSWTRASCVSPTGPAARLGSRCSRRSATTRQSSWPVSPTCHAGTPRSCSPLHRSRVDLHRCPDQPRPGSRFGGPR